RGALRSRRAPRRPAAAPARSTARRPPRRHRRPSAATGGGILRAELPPDPVEETVDEAGGLLGRKAPRDLERLLDGDVRRDLDAPEQIQDPSPKDVAVHDRHAVELPVLGEARDQLVDLRLVGLDAPDEGVGERPYVVGGRLPPPERVDHGPRIRVAPDVQLIKELEGALASLAAPTHGATARAAARPPWRGLVGPRASRTARRA